MFKKTLTFSFLITLAFGGVLLAQDESEHSEMHHDMSAMGQSHTPTHQDVSPPGEETPWLHKALERLPGGGGNFHDVYHQHEDLFKRDPEARHSMLDILRGMLRMTTVTQEIDREKAAYGEAGIRRELLQRKEADRQFIDDAMDRLAADPLTRDIHHELMSSPMESVYKFLDFHMDVPKYQKADPSAPAFEYGAGQKLEKGDLSGAIHDANTALKLDPKDVQAMILRAAAKYKMADTVGANDDARAALQIQPNNTTAYAIMKLTESRIPAVDTRELSSQIPQKDVPAVVGGGAGSGKVSVADLGQSAKYADESAHFLQMHDFTAAVTQASRALEENGGNVRAYDLRALGYMGLGQYELAVRDARAALELLPNDRLALNILSKAQNHLHHYDEAKVSAEREIGINPQDADAWYNLAYAEAGMGHRDAMLAALKKAAELNPDRYTARYNEAVQAPSQEDLTLLFSDQYSAANVSKPAAESGIGSRKNRQFLLIVIASLLGGVMIASGLFQSIFSSGRDSRARSLDAAGAELASNGSGSAFSGKFKLLRQIGFGGMGKVYEAMDLSLQRPVAVKLMREEIQADSLERARFLKEARLVAALHHPNIVEIYSVIEEGKDLYLVFELVQGKTLAELIKDRGRLPFEEVLPMMKDICAALTYAHGRGIIHRDLKPANIMRTEQGAVKVMDFGVARQTKETLSVLALTNTVVGTPQYMAPEADQGVVCRESDIYSLGVCLYEFLAGRMPFSGSGAGMLISKTSANFRPLSTLVAGLPEGIDEFVARALAPEPGKRFKTAAEFFEALRLLANHIPHK